MRINGWESWSVFERYAVIAQSEIASAMQKLEVQQATEKEKAKKISRFEFGHHLGITEGRKTDSRVALPVPTGKLN